MSHFRSPAAIRQGRRPATDTYNAWLYLLEAPGGRRLHPLPKIRADPPIRDPKTASGVDYNHHCWHEDSFTLYPVHALNSEPSFVKICQIQRW